MEIKNNCTIGYNERRNILQSGYDIEQLDDLFSLGNKIIHKLTGKGYNLFFKGLFFSFTDQHSPCHFFNSINLGGNPWIVTFETTIPRLGNVNKFWYDLAMKQLAKPTCKKIIAISQCAYGLELNFLQLNYPQYLEVVKSKMLVMPPPQKLLITDYSEKRLQPESISFTLVGSDFFRKGGREVLAVFDELIPTYPELKLNIVSDLSYGDYATHATIDDYEKALKIIKRYPKNIFHYSTLPNEKVLELFKQSHIGLLPTWADTYGYSVLEAQAAGCPVITTNVRALPEINNNEIGWIIDMPVNADKNAGIATIIKKNEFQKTLEKELKKIILSCLTEKNIISRKGIKAMNAIKKNHSLESFSEQFNNIYHLFE